MNSYLPLRPVSILKLRDWLLRSLIIAVVIGTCGVASVAQSPDHGRPLKVMTRNLYQGTDFVEAMSATDVNSFFAAVTTTIQNVRATKPPVRIAAVAQEIADNTPDLVAIQEATLWEVGAPGAYTAEIDPVALLLSDLNKLGEPYVKIIVQPQFDFQAPCTLGYWVHTTTQIAILARADSLREQMKVTDKQGGLFQYELPVTLPDPLGSINVNRGWAYADVTWRGRPVRFVTAHPESFYDPIENAQVYELISGVANPYAAGRPVIMAADFNTNALAPAYSSQYAGYALITGIAGFTDAWAATEKTAGYTCCQLNSLTNKKSLLDQRIDFVFTSGAVAENAKLTGNKPDDRVDGLWPSDHAGLVARIRLGN
ncbi:MAG: endonuclease/exonuclease/phosphatase family protein [Terriglobales bacterium]